MSASQALNILKEAILLERRGKAFYNKVAEQAADPSVKEFFEIMAKEDEAIVWNNAKEDFEFFGYERYDCGPPRAPNKLLRRGCPRTKQ